MSAERLDLWDDTIPTARRNAVFDRAARPPSRDPAAQIGLNSHTRSDQHDLIGFHRNENDRKPPSPVLTAQLLGDPSPDRIARSDMLRETICARRRPAAAIATPKVLAVLRCISDEPKNLAELREAMGIGHSAASDRAAAAVAKGFARRMGNDRHSMRFAITPEGLDVLEAQPQ